MSSYHLLQDVSIRTSAFHQVEFHHQNHWGCDFFSDPALTHFNVPLQTAGGHIVPLLQFVWALLKQRCSALDSAFWWDMPTCIMLRGFLDFLLQLFSFPAMLRPFALVFFSLFLDKGLSHLSTSVNMQQDHYYSLPSPVLWSPPPPPFWSPSQDARFLSTSSVAVFANSATDLIMRFPYWSCWSPQWNFHLPKQDLSKSISRNPSAVNVT